MQAIPFTKGVTQDNIKELLDNNTTFWVTVVPWFLFSPYEQQVVITILNDKLYWRWPTVLYYSPVELKKYSNYIYIDGQVVYVKDTISTYP